MLGDDRTRQAEDEQRGAEQEQVEEQLRQDVDEQPVDRRLQDGESGPGRRRAVLASQEASAFVDRVAAEPREAEDEGAELGQDPRDRTREPRQVGPVHLVDVDRCRPGRRPALELQAGGLVGFLQAAVVALLAEQIVGERQPAIGLAGTGGMRRRHHRGRVGRWGSGRGCRRWRRGRRRGRGLRRFHVREHLLGGRRFPAVALEVGAVRLEEGLEQRAVGGVRRRPVESSFRREAGHERRHRQGQVMAADAAIGSRGGEKTPPAARRSISPSLRAAGRPRHGRRRARSFPSTTSPPDSVNAGGSIFAPPAFRPTAEDQEAPLGSVR